MATYKYLFTDGMTHETVEVFDIADLKRFPAIKARRHLQNAYGDEDEEVDYESFDSSEDCTPDFDRLTGWELSGWCEWRDIMFEANGFPHWADAAERVDRVRIEHDVYGDEIYSFAELPSDEARDAAAEWMWQHGCMGTYLAISNRHQLSADDLRLCANANGLLFTADGKRGFLRSDCNEQ